MRSRLGISISVGTLDLIECGPAAEEVQSLTTTSRSILSPDLRRRRGDHLRNAFLKRAAEHDETVHINGMLAASQPLRASQESWRIGSRAGRWAEEAVYQPPSRTEPDAAGRPDQIQFVIALTTLRRILPRTRIVGSSSRSANAKTSSKISFGTCVKSGSTAINGLMPGS